MSDMEINQVLAQMRAMATAASSGRVGSESDVAQGADFGALMKDSISQVNEAQSHAKEMATAASVPFDQLKLELRAGFESEALVIVDRLKQELT